ncbi:MAG: DUF6446 family protein [Cypionkella sp.]
MNGKIVAGSIVLIAAIAGFGGYWLQEYAFYDTVAFTPGSEVVLTPIASPTPEAIPVKDVQGIDATSSPLRFRACFTSQMSLATLTEAYKVYDKATPLNAPSWFSCFDAGKITEALTSGQAVAFLGQANVVPNTEHIEIDRVIAVFPDGRAFAWNQLAPGVEQ